MKQLNQKSLIICLLMSLVIGVSAADISTDYFWGDRVVKNSIVVITEKIGLAKSTTNSMKTLASQIADDVKSVIPKRGVEEWIVTGDMEAALKKLNAVPGVTAFPNYVYDIEPTGKIIKSEDGVPADPYFPYQWALHNNGAAEDSLASIFGSSILESSVAGADIDMIRAWKAMEGKTMDTVLVVVFDTGIDYNHPDLQGKIWTNPGEIPDNGIDDDGNGFVDDYYGYDAAYDDSDPMDVYGHGTGVAGIIGATIDTIGMSGIAPNVKLIAVKAGMDNGYLYTIGILRGLYYVSVLQEQMIESGSSARIIAINHSWGGYHTFNEYNERLAEVTRNYALDHARMGIAWINSAGNAYTDSDETLLYRYPSTLQVPNMIAIGATDYMENIVNIWWGSNHGMASVDLGAPGLQVLSTAPGGDYQEFGGTSGATPYAVGVFAAAKGLYPNESYNDIFIRLMAGADRKTSYDGYWMTEARLNALNTIQPDSMGLSTKFNVDKLFLLCAPLDGEAVGNAGFVNGTGSSVNVSAVTLTYTDGAMESRAIDISAKNLTVASNGAFGVAVSIPLSEIIAGDNGYSRSGTIDFGGVGSIPFEVTVKRYPSISVSPEFTELPPVAWGETVSSEFTISNSGDIDLEFLIIPTIYFDNRDLGLFLLSVNQAPVNMPETSKPPRDFEEVAELDYQILSKALKNSERPLITIDAAESESDPFMMYWSDSLNDAAEVAQDWEILDYGSGDNWELFDIDTSQAVDNVFLAGDFTNGYQNNTLSVAASPYFNFRSIIESEEKIPVYLQFDYATELEEDCDFFYINMISESGKIATIASTSRDLISVTDSAQTVMIDISSWLANMVYADSVTFWFIANMDESNSAGFGVLFDNVSLWLGEPLVYRDASGNGVLDDIVPPGQDFLVFLTLNTGFFPEGEIFVFSQIHSNDPWNEWIWSDLIVNTEYGHITVTPEYSFVDSLYRGETVKSTFSITNDGLVDIKYRSLLAIQYQAAEPVLRINIDNVSSSTQQKSEAGIDHKIRSDRFHSRLSNIKDRPVLQSIDRKAVSSIYKATEVELQSESWSWMETFDTSMEIPVGWTSMDYTYGFGGSWAIDSIDIDSVTKTNVALFGDLKTLEYYNRSDCELFSPWILIPDSDTMRTILEFDYSTMMERYYDWFDIYVIWREPGDETWESWRDRPIATNDPGWSSVPLLISDTELHTFSTRLPLRVKGKEVMLFFYINTDESVNTGYTLFDNVMLYQKPRNFYMTNRFGELAMGETVNIDMAVKNTKILMPGDYSIYSLVLYRYEYDSLYNDIFGDYGDIFLGQNLTEFTILNHEPVVQPDTLFAISGEVIGFKKILASITRNDYDIDDSVQVINVGEPVYGEFKDLLGIGNIRDNMLGYAYVAPLLPETRDRLEDKFIYWSTDGWSIVGAPVTINVLQTPQFIRSAQHVFPINEDDSLTIDMMRLAAGLSIPGIRLDWISEPTVSLKMIEESALITITPIPDFFGTTSAMLYLKRNIRTIDSTLVQFVVHSVNDMPTAALTMSVSTNTVSFTDESNDNRDKDGGIVAWNWDFGDDLTSDEQNPVHVYAEPGTYHITLTVTDNAGAQASVEATVQIAPFVGLADGALAIPEEFRMHQNFPNPFNPTTTINYDISKESHVRIELYDLSGRLINTFVDKKQPAGYYSIHWDASRYSSGVYIYRIQAGGFSAVKKCLLVK